MRKLLLLSALCALAMLVASPVLAQSRGPSGADGTYNCSDFDDQGQAQEFFNAAGPGDPDGLDEDGDGQACESLPTIVNDGTPDGQAIPGGGEEQYGQYASTPTPQPTTATPVPEAALPETGGASMILPMGALLFAGGLVSLGILRRR